MSATKPMPVIAKADPGPELTVAVTWKDGERKKRADLVDLAPVVMAYKMYQPLRKNRGLFEAVRLEDAGTRLVWTDDIDMAATTVERLANETMTNDDFKKWLEANKLSYNGAAAALGISRRQAIYYAQDKDVPRTIVLACKGFEASKAA